MTAQESWARIVSCVLLVMGLFGFFFVDQMWFFGVSLLHNWLFLAIGIVGVWAGWSSAARVFNRIIGVVFLILAIAGFEGLLSLLSVTIVDKWLILIIAVFSLGIGFFVDTASSRK